jgi:hypothetical protein
VDPDLANAERRDSALWVVVALVTCGLTLGLVVQTTAQRHGDLGMDSTPTVLLTGLPILLGLLGLYIFERRREIRRLRERLQKSHGTAPELARSLDVLGVLRVLERAACEEGSRGLADALAEGALAIAGGSRAVLLLPGHPGEDRRITGGSGRLPSSPLPAWGTIAGLVVHQPGGGSWSGDQRALEDAIGPGPWADDAVCSLVVRSARGAVLLLQATVDSAPWEEAEVSALRLLAAYADVDLAGHRSVEPLPA